MTFIPAAVILALLAPGPQAQPAAAAKASIEGYVLRAGTGEPIARARITASRTSGPDDASFQPNRTVAIPPLNTGSDGHFLVTDLTPGTYLVMAQRNGFARQGYGARAPGRGGTPLKIAAGEAVKDIVIRLTPAGAVSGRVSDPAGEPLTGVNVELLKPIYDEDGRRVFDPEGSAKTDDHGEYRIYSMTPGRYYVKASVPRSPMENFPQEPSSNEVIDPGYVLTYYPGTADPSAAMSIEIAPGGELSAIDFTLAQQRLFKIRGRVMDSRTGQIPRNVTMFVAPRENPMLFGDNTFDLSSYNTTNGTFEVKNLTPGQYWVSARTNVFSGAATPAPERQQGRIAVDVSNADVENVVIVFSPGMTIPGRLSIEGGAAVSSLPNLDSVEIVLTPVVAGREIPTASMEISKAISNDGTFVIENVQPGSYRLSMTPLQQGFYVKEAQLDSADILGGASISGSVSGGLEIVLSSQVGEVDGTLVDRDHHPVRGVQAILIPDGLRNRHDLYRYATSDQNGQFIMRTVAPGDYKLFAWEDIDDYEFNDPEFLRKYEELGTPVKITELSKLPVEVKVIPAGQ
ncbi:MAG TPA: carboxypeptidase-like regulatory domain-containing protein [Terriglobia bacterium]|jgi:hypothetical protein